MISETSHQAYKSLKDLGDKQRVVYEAIKTLGRATNEEIGIFLGWPDKSVTGRTSELFRYGMVAVDGRKPTRSGNTAKAWVIKDLNDSKLKRFVEQVEKNQKVYGAAIPWAHDD